MIPAVTRPIITGKSQEAFNRIGEIFNHGSCPRVLAAKTDKNIIFVARYITDASNLHFQVYNKNCKMTDTFVLTSRADGAGVDIDKYSAFQNNVMRTRDAMDSPNKDMSFEQILQSRPVIVKRIESLVNTASEMLGKRNY